MRDPRWGRAEETYGEDPYLVSRMGVAAVRGLQGAQAGRIRRRPRDRDAEALGRARPAGGAASTSARQPLGERADPRGVPPAVRGGDQGGERARRDARRTSRSTASPRTPTAGCCSDILRKEWGFDGLVVSRLLRDRAARSRCTRCADSDAAAARLALEAGVDVELPDPKLYPLLRRAGEVEGDPDRADRQAGGARAASEVRAGPVRAAVRRRRAGGQDRRAAPSTRRWRARRPTIDRAAEERGRAAAARPRARSRRSRSSAPTREPCRLGGYSGVPKRCVGVLRGIKEAAGSGGQGDVGAGRA